MEKDKEKPEQTADAEDIFYSDIESLLTDDEKSQLGNEAGRKIGEAIMYLAPFAPAPATFDAEAFGFIAELAGDELRKMLEILVRTRVLKEEGGRYSIASQQMVDRAKSFMV